MTTGSDEVERARRLARQKTTITTLATLLIVAGAVVLLFLDRIPLPLRIAVGLGDIIAGWGLLVLVRQKFK